MPVIDHYQDRGGISALQNDYVRGTMPAGIQSVFQTRWQELSGPPSPR